MKETGEDILDHIIGADFANNICTSQRTQLDGASTLSTIEPANIQAMLATQFKVSLKTRRIFKVTDEGMS